MTVTQSARLGDNRIGGAPLGGSGSSPSTSAYLPTVELSFVDPVDVQLTFEESGA